MYYEGTINPKCEGNVFPSGQKDHVPNDYNNDLFCGLKVTKDVNKKYLTIFEVVLGLLALIVLISVIVSLKKKNEKKANINANPLISNDS